MWKKLFCKRKTKNREALQVVSCPEKSALVYVSGKIIPMEKCGEPMFEQKTLGDGAVIIPEDGRVIAPFDCEVIMAFATGHAFGLSSSFGVECMLHLGIDTVHIKETVFRSLVSEGDKVPAGTVLAYADLEAIKRHGKNIAMLCILTNGDQWKIIEKKTEGDVRAGQTTVMRFEKL